MLSVISTHSSLIPFLVGVIFSRNFSKDLKLYTILFVLAVIFDQILFVLYLLKINNWLVIHFWILIEYVVTIYVFSYWQKNSKLQKILRWSIPVYTVFWIIVKILKIEDWYWVPVYTRPVAGIILIIVVLCTLIKLGEKDSYIYKNYQFWICVGALLYFSGNIVFFSILDVDIVEKLWFLHDVTNISANFLYAGGFWCHHYQLKHGLSFY
jgi:hypothetical protein